MWFDELSSTDPDSRDLQAFVRLTLNFLKEVVWSIAGVSGIWYRPLPEIGTEANLRAATHLRASSVFFNRCWYSPLLHLPSHA